MPKCTECGKEFDFLLGQFGNWAYKHKVQSGSDVNTKFQCSYTCYNHSKLRTSYERKHLTKANYLRDVKISEETMKAQGKTILHPIDITKSAEKRLYKWEEKI